MNNIKSIFFVLFVALFLNETSAQNSGFYWNNLNENSNRVNGKILGETFLINPTANRYFFLQEDWTIGKIITEDDDVYDNFRIRYLAFGDELIAYNTQIRTLFTVDKEIVKSFVFNDNLRERTFVKIYFDGINKGDKYFEQLYLGSRNLLAFHHVGEKKVVPYTDKSGVLRDTEFNMIVTYYVYTEKSGFEKINTKRRSILKVFPEKKKEIKKLFRQHKLFVNSEVALIQAFTLLDEAGLLN
jgi:hypothetical protein